ncbi:MAG: AAA family ATPase [Victivallales bacterium]|nr:AAA family ATPase [Victivallales bacterium]
MKKLNNLDIKNFGPIREAHLSFGDLTILIGPQASGKSLALQLLKLLLDGPFVISIMEQYNFVIGKNPDNILNFYFGEGLSELWTTDTQIYYDFNSFTKKELQNYIYNVEKERKRFTKQLCLDLGEFTSFIPIPSITEHLFYIPAQRIISIADGRPKNFIEYDSSTPFILRQFSEILRMYFLYGFSGNKVVFPLKNRLKGGIKKAFQNSVFHNGKVIIDDSSGQKKMQLSIDSLNIPFMAWSAGQKEFMPLLMAFYCLSGPSQKVVDHRQFHYVVLEEPEMGLHPKAIQSVLLQIIELMQNGYKVIVSTHSQVLLEFAWAFNTIKASNIQKELKEKMLQRMFGLEKFETCIGIIKNVFEKSISTYYFNDQGKGVETRDISDLNVASDDQNMANWGGLSQFSDKASEIVSQVINGEYE